MKTLNNNRENTVAIVGSFAIFCSAYIPEQYEDLLAYFGLGVAVSGIILGALRYAPMVPKPDES